MAARAARAVTVFMAALRRWRISGKDSRMLRAWWLHSGLIGVARNFLVLSHVSEHAPVFLPSNVVGMSCTRRALLSHI